MTLIEKLVGLEALFKTLLEKMTAQELIQLADKALKRLTELKEHEQLLSEIF